jgi:hypothetical protein
MPTSFVNARIPVIAIAATAPRAAAWTIAGTAALRRPSSAAGAPSALGGASV